MPIKFCIDKIDSFLPEIANHFGLEIENNRFEIPTGQGKGYFSQIQFSSDILIAYYQLTLKEVTSIIRQKSENDNIIPIIFWISNCGITQEINTESKLLGKDTPNGIFLPANRIETSYNFPANTLIRNITLFVTKEWLNKNIISKNNYISKTIINNTNYFLFEEINTQIEQILNEIESMFISETKNPLDKLKLCASTLTLCYSFFKKILNRSFNKQTININPIDVERIFKIKAIVKNNYVTVPSLNHLAVKAGMNKRKMQGLFKQIFGTSIYQFALSIKMSEAKKMLQSQRYSVSEVGYAVGYSNLSHFTEQFKKFYGITPKVYLLSL